MKQGRGAGAARAATKVAAVMLFLLTALPAAGAAGDQRVAETAITTPVLTPGVGRDEMRNAYRRRTALVVEALEAGLRAPSRADSLLALTMAVDTALLLTLTAPDDPDSHYLYAAAVGQRLELSGTREKIRLGAVARTQAETALELDPEHAGAHHVLGRLNAAAMRMGRVSRFVARRLLGGEALKNVSWASAEGHFTKALAMEPWNPRHAMELGVLLAEVGREAEAVPTLRYAIGQPAVTLADSTAIARATLVLGTLECDCPR